MNLNATILTTPCLDLFVSENYYALLDFKICNVDQRHFALAKDFTIELNTSPFARPGIKMIRSKSTLENLPSHLTNIKIGEDLLIVSPEGCCVYLSDTPLPYSIHDLPKKNTVLGNFNGVSLESVDLAASLEFWQKIGFNHVGGSVEKGWVIMKNEDDFDLNLMHFGLCPHLFSNPGLNFFNGANNPAIIREIKNRKLPIQQEITHFNPGFPAENLIVQDIGGLTFFIFND
jgi:hypothetical protein